MKSNRIGSITAAHRTLRCVILYPLLKLRNLRLKLRNALFKELCFLRTFLLQRRVFLLEQRVLLLQVRHAHICGVMPNVPAHRPRAGGAGIQPRRNRGVRVQPAG